MHPNKHIKINSHQETLLDTHIHTHTRRYTLGHTYEHTHKNTYKLTPVQAAAKSFGDIPILGNLINTIRDYEDRINYRNADPEMRRLLGLE